MILSQPTRLPIIVASTILLMLIVGLYNTSSGSLAARYIFSLFTATKPHFHLLLPATATNLNFCKLLLSAAITGYPEPIVLGWEGHGQYNGSESHLFKISETLAYLNRLPSTADDELVLLLDAYDIWLQLPLEVLIRRYHVAIDKGNVRLRSEGTYGAHHGGAQVKQSIIFGPDKTCWPDDKRRAACWAVPKSSLAPDAFGPATDTWIVPNRPRWLNSGTIMGPAKDMRDMFAATMDMLNRKFDEGYEFKNSDQYYFQEMWAEQEINRLVLRDGNVEAPNIKDGVDGDLPMIPQDSRTEFHVTLDYESDVFQTSAYYTEYLTWMSFNHSTPSAEKVGGNLKRIDQFVLMDDVLRSSPRFPTENVGGHMPTAKGWQDMMLGTNVITQQVFPVLHMTNEKRFRELWWPRMWFHPHARALLESAERKSALGSGIIAKVDGVSHVISAKDKVGQEGQGNSPGVWTERSEFLYWENVCGAYQGELFI